MSKKTEDETEQVKFSTEVFQYEPLVLPDYNARGMPHRTLESDIGDMEEAEYDMDLRFRTYCPNCEYNEFSASITHARHRDDVGVKTTCRMLDQDKHDGSNQVGRVNKRTKVA